MSGTNFFSFSLRDWLIRFCLDTLYTAIPHPVRYSSKKNEILVCQLTTCKMNVTYGKLNLVFLWLFRNLCPKTILHSHRRLLMPRFHLYLLRNQIVVFRKHHPLFNHVHISNRFFSLSELTVSI